MSIEGQGHFFTIYFQVLYVLYFTRPRHQVSVYRTTGPLVLMPDFSTIDNRCLDSLHILISGQVKHRYPLNNSCSKIFDSRKIKRMV